jgi:hypothetical protein
MADGYEGDIERKRKDLIQRELNRLADDGELEAVEDAISSGKGFDAAFQEAVNIFVHLHGALEPKKEAETLKLVYQKVQEIGKLSDTEVECWYADFQQAERSHGDQLDKTAFFNKPEAEADFSYWKRKDKLYAEEAVALSLGKNPKSVNSETLKGLHRPNSPFVIEYTKRLESLERAIDEQHIRQPLTHAKLTQWADAEGFDLPPQFDAKTIQSSKLDDGDRIHHGTMDVFYKFLVGMAIKHYQFDSDYDPEETDDTSTVFTAMAKDLESVNAYVSEKTLREHMKKALRRARALSHRYKNPTRTAKSR